MILHDFPATWRAENNMYTKECNILNTNQSFNILREKPLFRAKGGQNRITDCQLQIQRFIHETIELF